MFLHGSWLSGFFPCLGLTAPLMTPAEYKAVADVRTPPRISLCTVWHTKASVFPLQGSQVSPWVPSNMVRKMLSISSPLQWTILETTAHRKGRVSKLLTI